jgi:hypothetical protein
MADAISPPEVSGLSEGQRIVDTFVAPSKTFTDILRKSSWWGPLLVLIAISIVFSFAVQTKVGWEKVFENNVRMSPKQEERFAQMSAEQAAPAKAIATKITQYSSYGFSLILLIITAIIALLVWATVNFGLGGTAKYGQVFAVYMYSSLVVSLKYILAIISLFAGLAPDSFLMNNPVGTNIGFYLSSDAPKWLWALGTHLDVFEIWSLVITVIGVAIVAKVSRGKAAAAVVGWWVIIVLLGVAGAALS